MVLLKVYGHIYPADRRLEQALADALTGAITDPISDDIPLISRNKDMLTISFEGITFPEEEVIAIVKAQHTSEQKGRLDVLDIDNWRMRRYTIDAQGVFLRSAPLNNVLDYSGF
ncbi:MAG: hypothetical protein IJU76_08625 [Desulfovibrionaceae bacterium]|nr:hypothetical protein [Desulfovibrionaceae bacterium]